MSEPTTSGIKVLRHPETNEVIWLEAESVLDLIEQLVAVPRGDQPYMHEHHEETVAEWVRSAEALLKAHGRLT
jgi:hypothetical protein